MQHRGPARLLTAQAESATLPGAANREKRAMPGATILQFPTRKIRPDLRAISKAIAGAGDDRLLDLACLSMNLAEDARHPGGERAPGTADALASAYLCAGIILGAIDREELKLD